MMKKNKNNKMHVVPSIICKVTTYIYKNNKMYVVVVVV